MPFVDVDGPAVKRQKLNAKDESRPLRPLPKPRIFAPFRTVGLVSPTAVPFATVPLGKSTFQITTSVGRCLQTYDLKRGLKLTFVTRPQTPGYITAAAAWADRVLGSWTDSTHGVRGVWVFKRGKKIGELQVPRELDEDVVQIIIFGSWIVGCCSTKIRIWSSATYEHYTTLLPPFGAGGGRVLTGGICSIPTYTNKICAGREDGTVEIWNVSTGKLIFAIQPPRSDAGPVSALQPTPALSLVAIAYVSGQVIIHDIEVDKEIIKVNAGTGDQLPITSISFRTDGLGAGDDGRQSGVMATASYNSGDVTLWDLNNGGRRMGVLRNAHKSPSFQNGADGGINKIEFLPSQAILVTTGLDNCLRTWIFDETPFSPLPRMLHSRGGHAAPVTTLNFLPSDADGADAGGKWLLSSSKDRSLWGWSLRLDAQSTELSQGSVRKKAKKLGILPNGNTGASDHRDVMGGLKAPEIVCLACSLNRDGGMGTMPGIKTIWASAKQLKGKPTATEYNLTGWESVVTGHVGDKFARTWFWGRKRAGRWIFETGDGTEVKSVAVSPCGTFALVGSAGGSIDMYNLQSGLHRQRFPAPLTKAQAKSMRAELITPSTIDIRPDAQKRWPRGHGRHTKAITGLVVDSLNRTVISSGLDGKVKFWDFMSGRLLHEINSLSSTGSTAFHQMVYHREGDLIGLICDDLIIRVADIETRKIVRELHGCKGQINDLCFSNDGRWIIAASSDAIIRVWDLPTSHLIDAIQLQSPCTALAFSNTGEYLATAHEDSVGVNLWTNRTLFTHVPSRHISEHETTETEGPTASGEGGQSILAAAFEQETEVTDAEDSDSALPVLDQLSEDIETLSLVPKSRWQTLLHLDLIRERNKPKEPPKAPEKAPFFLPSLERGSKTKLDEVLAQGETDLAMSAAERSRIMKMDRAAGQSRFTFLLRECAFETSYEPFITHLSTLQPAAADIEIRSLDPIAPYTELINFVDALTQRLRAKRDYELVQAWMAVFLKCHGEVVVEDAGLQAALRSWREEQKKEAERLGSLLGFCSGVVGFLRSAG